MSTSRTISFDYPETPAEVAALLHDPVFLRSRSESAGEFNIDIKVEKKGDAVYVTCAREKDVEVPAFAKMVLGSARRAVEKSVWRQRGDQWIAEYEISVSGVPVTSKGRSVLAPQGNGCRYTSTFEVEAKIPLVGRKIEALVADGLSEQLIENAKRNADALTRGKPAPHSYINALRGDRDQAEEG